MLHESANIWQSCLAFLKQELPSQSFNTWIEPLRIQHIDPNRAVLIAPDAFFCDWVDEHYRSVLERAVYEVAAWRPEFCFSAAVTDLPSAVTPSTAEQRVPVNSVPSSSKIARPVSSFALNPRYRFDNFIIGDSNEFAFSAAKAVAEAPGKTAYNPYVIYSGVGLGKTHLLQAIGDYCLNEGTAQNVVYITAEKFISDYINSLRKREMDRFVATYRSTDLLLVDDIQFFLKTEGSQREFFHTFNVLFQNDKQIVLSADCAPPSLQGFEPRLISRFQSGLVASIDSPGLETRIAIVNHRAIQQGVELSDDVARHIAEANPTNVRELEGALTRVIALSSLTGKDISVDLVTQMLPHIKAQTRKLSVKDILDATSKHFQLESRDIEGKSRKQDISQARHVSMYLAKALTGLSLKMIGASFGGRDHSTVVHACRNIDRKLKKDDSLQNALSSIQSALGVSINNAA
jgi:chromosomal replication initiator protein